MSEIDVADPVLQTVELGFQWPTVDPFLFCVHHLDRYPAGNGRFGPAASLDGRQIGSDFEDRDGWRMYHGTEIPGFPSHPHRGFETVTYARQGYIDHSDSMGAAARFGRGDVQWMTAGGGVVHSEMFPLLDTEGPNTVELFQIWLNLPAEDKLVEPHFAMLWDTDIPRLVVPGDGGDAEVTVIAGELDGLTPPAPPPRSWAGRHDAEVAIWHIRLEPGARWVLPPTRHDDTNRTLYVFDGQGVTVGAAAREVARSTAAVVRTDEPVSLTSDGGAEVLMLQGRPISQPVAQYGPFVMNTRAEIHAAVEDYQRTGFGGWPWDRDDPVHDASWSRFARHADGREEAPAP
ncbi:MAG: pirin family protein [Acidimicrobiia bacterium]|nr:pirin family protein [Acidimicrobiia bacterium]